MVQAATIILALIGLASVLLIGLAINDIYHKLDSSTFRLCRLEQRQWDAIEAIALRLGEPIPHRLVTRGQCTSVPGDNFPGLP